MLKKNEEESSRNPIKGQVLRKKHAAWRIEVTTRRVCAVAYLQSYCGWSRSE